MEEHSKSDDPAVTGKETTVTPGGLSPNGDSRASDATQAAASLEASKLLKRNGLKQYIQKFKDEEFDDPSIWRHITEDELKDIGMKKGSLVKWRKMLATDDYFLGSDLYGPGPGLPGGGSGPDDMTPGGPMDASAQVAATNQPGIPMVAENMSEGEGEPHPDGEVGESHPRLISIPTGEPEYSQTHPSVAPTFSPPSAEKGGEPELALPDGFQVGERVFSTVAMLKIPYGAAVRILGTGTDPSTRTVTIHVRDEATGMENGLRPKHLSRGPPDPNIDLGYGLRIGQKCSRSNGDCVELLGPGEQAGDIAYRVLESFDLGRVGEEFDDKAATLVTRVHSVHSLNSTQPEEPRKPAPPPLPEGWQAHWDTKHKRYYYLNLTTNKTQWEEPTAPSEEPMLPPTPEKTPQRTSPNQEIPKRPQISTNASVGSLTSTVSTSAFNTSQDGKDKYNLVVSEPSSELHAGDNVELHGLKSKEYNGQTGELVAPVSGGWQIKLRTGELKKFRSHHIRKTATPTGSSTSTPGGPAIPLILDQKFTCFKKKRFGTRKRVVIISHQRLMFIFSKGQLDRWESDEHPVKNVRGVLRVKSTSCRVDFAINDDGKEMRAPYLLDFGDNLKREAFFNAANTLLREPLKRKSNKTIPSDGFRHHSVLPDPKMRSSASTGRSVPTDTPPNVSHAPSVPDAPSLQNQPSHDRNNTDFQLHTADPPFNPHARLVD